MASGRGLVQGLRGMLVGFFRPPPTPPAAGPQLVPCLAAAPGFGAIQQGPKGESESDPLSVFGTSIVLMAVPKRRTSHSKKRMRMTTKYLRNKTHYQTCKHCGQLHMRHHLCTGCMELGQKQQSSALEQDK